MRVPILITILALVSGPALAEDRKAVETTVRAYYSALRKADWIKIAVFEQGPCMTGPGRSRGQDQGQRDGGRHQRAATAERFGVKHPCYLLEALLKRQRPTPSAS